MGGTQGTLLKCCGLAVIAGLVIAFSIPVRNIRGQRHDCPLQMSDKSWGGLLSLAAMAGIQLRSGGRRHAIYPDLYPDIVNSTPFYHGSALRAGEESWTGKIDTTLYCYLMSTLYAPLVEYDNFCPFQAPWLTISFVR